MGEFQIHEAAPTSPSPRLLETTTASELQLLDIPELQYVVDELLPEGLTLVVAPPKYGKSWLVLDLCLLAAEGLPFLGYRTYECGVLYLALEDSMRRLKARINTLLGAKAAPDNFHLATKAGQVGTGLVEEIENHIKANPDTGLIAIDVLARVRGNRTGRIDAYTNDYSDLLPLKAIADKHRISVVIVHHTRKMKDEADVFNSVSGTNALMGAADTTWIMQRKQRGDDRTRLHVIGRDVEAKELVIKHGNGSPRWVCEGTQETVDERDLIEEYNSDPLIKTIKVLMQENPLGIDLKADELIAETLRVTGGLGKYDKAIVVGKFLMRIAPELKKDGIQHEYKKRTNGYYHIFRFIEKGEIK